MRIVLLGADAVSATWQSHKAPPPDQPHLNITHKYLSSRSYLFRSSNRRIRRTSPNNQRDEIWVSGCWLRLAATKQAAKCLRPRLWLWLWNRSCCAALLLWFILTLLLDANLFVLAVFFRFRSLYANNLRCMLLVTTTTCLFTTTGGGGGLT